MDMEKKTIELLNIGCLIGVVVLFFGYSVNRIYGITMYPDEFGYWASAANLLGWDWTQVASLGSYYSFGYSLILYPILAFTTDSITAYRTAIGVNFVLLIISFFLLREIGHSLFGKTKGSTETMFAGIAVLYPAWLMYAQMSLTEASLIFMIILLVYLWVRFLKKPGIIRGFYLVLAGVYAYSLHLRALGTLIACALTLLVWALFNPSLRKKVLLLLLLGVIAVILLMVGKEVIQQSIYSEADPTMLQNNDYGGQIDKIRMLFTWAGIRNFIVIMAGKFLYMGFSTGGLAIWGIYWCGCKVYQLIRAIRHGIEQTVSGWVSVLVILIALGQLVVSTIYSIGIQEPDWIIYGRYIEMIIPILAFLGAYGICKSNKKMRVQTGILVLYGAASGLCVWACYHMESSHVRGAHSAVTSILIGDGNIVPKVFFTQIWLIGSLGMVITMVITYYLSKEGVRSKQWILICLVAVEVLIAVRISQMQIYSSSQNMRMDLAIVDVLSNEKFKEKEILFLQEGGWKWVDFLQMQFRDRTMRLIRGDEISRLSEEELKDSVILAYYNSEYLDEISMYYSHQILSDVYYLFY